MSFSGQVGRWVRDTKGGVDRDVRAITLSLFSAIIKGTPVDEGRARGNWQTTVGEPTASIIERMDLGGGAAIADVINFMSGAGGVSWLSNNLPYIQKLEYGGYPDGPKTVNGFSRQAPAGMVRINLARVDEIIRNARKQPR